MKYNIYYYLPNQSTVFTEPRHFATDNLQAFLDAIRIAEKENYDIVEITTK